MGMAGTISIFTGVFQYSSDQAPTAPEMIADTLHCQYPSLAKAFSVLGDGVLLVGQALLQT